MTVQINDGSDASIGAKKTSAGWVIAVDRTSLFFNDNAIVKGRWSNRLPAVNRFGYGQCDFAAARLVRI